MTRDEAIRLWINAKRTAEQWADYERKLRDQLVAGAFTDATGTQRVDLGGGYELKLVRSDRIKVENKPELFGAMKLIGDNYPNERSALNDVIKWDPKTTLGKWTNAPPATKHFLSQFVTITPNAPALTLEEPKS